MELYKFSSSWDRNIFRLGLFFSTCAGLVLPCYGIIIGRIVEMFDPDNTDEMRHEMMMDALYIIIGVSIATFIFNYLGYALMQMSAERLSFKLRAKYLRALMCQEIEFFEL